MHPFTSSGLITPQNQEVEKKPSGFFDVRSAIRHFTGNPPPHPGKCGKT